MHEAGALLDNSVVDRSGRQPYHTVPDVPSTNPALALAGKSRPLFALQANDFFYLFVLMKRSVHGSGKRLDYSFRKCNQSGCYASN